MARTDQSHGAVPGAAARTSRGGGGDGFRPPGRGSAAGHAGRASRAARADPRNWWREQAAAAQEATRRQRSSGGSRSRSSALLQGADLRPRQRRTQCNGVRQGSIWSIRAKHGPRFCVVVDSSRCHRQVKMPRSSPRPTRAPWARPAGPSWRNCRRNRGRTASAIQDDGVRAHQAAASTAGVVVPCCRRAAPAPPLPRHHRRARAAVPRCATRRRPRSCTADARRSIE